MRIFGKPTEEPGASVLQNEQTRARTEQICCGNPESEKQNAVYKNPRISDRREVRVEITRQTVIIGGC